MSERGDDISDSHMDNVRTVRVTTGCVKLTLLVEVDRDGDFVENSIEIIGSELVEVDDIMAAQIQEQVGR